MSASMLALEAGFFIVVGLVLGAVLLIYSVYYLLFKLK
jgi:hypothetical protein